MATIQLQNKLHPPKIVSSFLGIKPSELHRETVNLIGRPAQPARTQGARSAYLTEDVLLMKLGKMLRDLGVSPGRVQECIQQVRDQWADLDPWPTIFEQMERVTIAFHRQGLSLFLIGEETDEGFKAFLVPESEVAGFLRIQPEYAAEDMETMFHAEDVVMPEGVFKPPEGVVIPPEGLTVEVVFKGGPVPTHPVRPKIILNLRMFMIQNAALLMQHIASMEAKP